MAYQTDCFTDSIEFTLARDTEQGLQVASKAVEGVLEGTKGPMPPHLFFIEAWSRAERVIEEFYGDNDQAARSVKGRAFEFIVLYAMCQVGGVSGDLIRMQKRTGRVILGDYLYENSRGGMILMEMKTSLRDRYKQFEADFSKFQEANPETKGVMLSLESRPIDGITVIRVNTPAFDRFIDSLIEDSSPRSAYTTASDICSQIEKEIIK